ncbi:MAG: hypothetical protein JRE23_09900 [Deltaproteobacteria bacterium]|nr:hypothetical protein [Deltaproteobacteria bacterium]
MDEKQSKIDFERELKNILKTNRRYFWDKGPLNHRRDKYIIIERILEFGTEVEVDVIQNYYGIEAVKSVVIESRGLSRPEASQSGTGTALFSPRSKILRLRTEMPCSCTALTGEKSGLDFLHRKNLTALNYLPSFQKN